MAKYKRTCPRCRQVVVVEADPKGYRAWRSGALIQDALPNLSDTEREMLMTGFCAACQEEIFREED